MAHMFNVFISKNTKDSRHSDRILKMLKDAGLSVFDSSEISYQGDADYAARIDQAIEESNNLIVICSKNEYGTGEGFSSRWVYYEWTMFRNEILSGRKDGNLLIVLADNIDISQIAIGLRKYECIHIEKASKLLNYISPRVDMSKEQDLRKKPFWSILAGCLMIGVIAVTAIYFSNKSQKEESVDYWQEGRRLYREQSYEKAYEYLAKCDAPAPTYYLGTMYENGWGVKKDIQKAIEYYRKAQITYEMGSRYDEAMDALARLGVPVVDVNNIDMKDYDDLKSMGAEYLFKAAQELIDPPLMGKKDYLTGYVYMTQAAELGYPPALEAMGDFQISELFGINDEVKAQEYYIKANEAYLKLIEEGHNDDGNLFYAFGLLLKNKLNDDGSALTCFTFGSKLGHEYCTLQAGVLNYELMNFDNAFLLLNQVQSMPRAKYYLAMMYESGLGVKKDRDKAIQLYKIVSMEQHQDAHKAEQALWRLHVD